MENDWVEIYTTTQEYQATMAKDLLENAGIKSVVLNQHDTAYQTFGEFAVYVADTDKEKAVELLKDLKN